MIGGAPFNVARHLQAFGLHPLLISRVGDDTLGDELMAALDGFGLDLEGIQIDSGHPTGSARIRMRENWHTFEILPDQAYDHIESGTALLAATGSSPPAGLFRHPRATRRGFEEHLADPPRQR